MTLTLPDSDDPELSVLMVTHGAWDLTERALAAVVANTARRFELIIVDNDSDANTRAQLSKLHGVRLLQNDRNRGFGPAVNQGVKHARADYLVLLNSDAFVQPGWLDPLLEAISQPNVGAVVPRCLHPDGSLQEAGALLARDGTVLVYGDGDDPGLGCYRFRRRIDYGSAVCMAIRLATFADLGGFDERYAPAYYEDADLCMRLAERGLNVVYEPRSTATHVRYGSGDLKTAIQLSERNRKLFAERWRAKLVGRPPTFRHATEQAAIAARDASAAPRVLICARPDEPGATRLAETLLDGWPRARVTWTTDPHSRDGFDPDRWLGRGVEVLDQQDSAWLSTRLFHYDVVVCGERVPSSFLAAANRSQPQAPARSLQELDGPPDGLRDRLVELLANAGIAPPAR